MTFKEAFKLMIDKGIKVKRPTWAGYWEWNAVSETIIMHCRESESDNGSDVVDIRSTQRVQYTINNILADDWIEATEENCPLLGGILKLSFDQAFDIMVRYKKHITSPRISPYFLTVLTESPLMPIYMVDPNGNANNSPMSWRWNATAEEIQSNDWTILED